MTYLDVCRKLNQINRAIECLTELSLMEGVHGMDREAIKEECIELHRAAHDTLREFEAECIQRGKEEAIRKATLLVNWPESVSITDIKGQLERVCR